MRLTVRWEKRVLAVVLAVWGIAVVGGIGALTRYASTPGALAAAPETWPSDSIVTRQPRMPTLVMLAHPHCACTRASVHELAKLMDQVGGRVNAHVLFVDPPGVGEGWDQTDLWQSAAAIDGVDVVPDTGGEEARRFGATTSGQVLLYDASGRLMFRGGITSARGHEGDNVGRARIVGLLAHEGTTPQKAPVFGCPLADEGGAP
jgi:hypothetical protein